MMTELEAITFLLSRGYKIEPKSRPMKKRLIKATLRRMQQDLGRLPRQREVAKALRLAQPASVAHWWAGVAPLRSGEFTYSQVWQKIFDSVGMGEEYRAFKYRKGWLTRRGWNSPSEASSS